jgi:arabinose-5-phosphate isomerase
MTAGGKRVQPHDLAAAALKLMDDSKISAVLVVDLDGRLVGALNMHDLLRAGVV